MSAQPHRVIALWRHSIMTRRKGRRGPRPFTKPRIGVLEGDRSKARRGRGASRRRPKGPKTVGVFPKPRIGVGQGPRWCPPSLRAGGVETGRGNLPRCPARVSLVAGQAVARVVAAAQPLVTLWRRTGIAA
jgi:hypothetical protein